MPRKIQKKVTIVREHPMRVPVSPKNPGGITIRDRHPRRLKGTETRPGARRNNFRVQGITQKQNRSKGKSTDDLSGAL
jgi:hypothetical protein